MKPHLHLHVGLGKCASTSLQTYLATHRDALLAQGLDYPDLGSGAAGNLTPFALSQRPDAARWGARQFDFEGAADRLRAALAAPGAPRVLLSSEALTHPEHKTDLDWVFDACATVTVHLILRPRAALFVAVYAQMVRAAGLYDDLASFLDSPLIQNGGAFADILEHWQSRVGTNAVRLHFIRPHGPPIVDTVMRSIVPDGMIPSDTAPRQNRAPSAFVLVALAYAQHPGHGSARPALGEIIRTAQAFDPDPTLGLLTPDIARDIDIRFATDTARFVGALDGITHTDIETDAASLHGIAFDAVLRLPAFRACVNQLGLPAP
ncbi:hypothetical protein [uncultured Tateyamaria sp.]|uniref:hypothetical protein n=1 Tax=Tateyamaria sp. 1078 TaxID=3417464 RepID=UPI00262C9905|nr:hypothetical protein [uncultured Tateyamaria sp.]